MCTGGVDANHDGIVDATGEPCFEIPTGCTPYEVASPRDGLILGVQDLRAYVERAFRKLRRAPRLAGDRGLKKRLARSVKRVSGKLLDISGRSTVLLSALPDVILVCSGVEACATVDNGALIASYQNTVWELQNVGTRGLSRATRLVYPIDTARKKTRPLGKRIRATSKALVAKSNELPVRQSVCAGGVRRGGQR